MTIAIGSDHAGVELKKELLSLFNNLQIQFVDFGTDSPESVDYPDFGEKVSEAVSSGKVDKGLLICGTGIGMSIVANKFPGIRASLCNDLFTAKMSRMHNDANVLVIGGRIVGRDLAKEIVRTWVSTPFEGDRHQRRLDKISKIEVRIKNHGI
ncbi:MAG TPA: ribose 5-phosphate isomerase B [Thermodesulfovibrionales bacterium]|nr:ribose 5-phosphate isomerase B [Thermodesulfovibrionales bacterium]